MAYLSKDTLLKVYRVLSENTETPDTQGSTQKISAVRHLFALARYIKVKNQSECNLRDRTNKDTFVDYVGDIVKLDDGLYTTNFYTGIKDLPDCGVSSNFFSAGAVAKSKVNPQVSIQYPANNTLFNVHNESLVPIRWNQIPLSFYITSAKCRLAFALWLVRKASIDESNILGSLKSILYRTYPNELIDLLLSPSNKISDALINELPCRFSPTIAQLNKEDIKSIFGDWESVDESISDNNNLLPEKVKELFKVYLERCCKTSHKTDQNPLYLSGNAPSSYMSFLETDRLFDYNPSKWSHISSIYKITNPTEAEEIFTKLMADTAFVERDRTNNQGWRSGAIGYYVCFLNALSVFSKVVVKADTPKVYEKQITPTNYDKYLRALRTKPFMLLAGISGTGKSRIVRELAFKSCPEYLRDADGTTPGNYLMVEVKPNWHDSSELLGYYSHLANNGNGGYVFTPFTKFLVKAMMFPNVPFFVCLDEMNLAPVEQYFAEFLSVLETRKHDKDNYIQTGVLVKPEYFQGISDHVGDGYICTEFFPDGLPKIDYPVYTNTILTNKGLSLLDNVFIIGTVNMDDTTHQFSRKVIDRAMTIEMNGGKLTEMFGHSADLEYLPADQVWELEKFLPQYVNADEVVAAHPEYEWLIQTQLPAILEDINDVLRDTPFQVSYRVLNEMVIYFSVLVESGMPSEEAKNLAVDQMLLMKILPRIEGDRDMLMLDAQTCRLDKLEPFAASEDTKKKIAEMKNRLNKQEFTRFWP